MMLTHVRTHLAAVLAPVQQATLATHGPAELLAHVVPCVADALHLFMLLPRTSDHLLNLETSPAVVVATNDWFLQGRARILTDDQRVLVPHFTAHPESCWNTMLEVTPTRINITQRQGWGAAETFDFDDVPVQSALARRTRASAHAARSGCDLPRTRLR